MTQRHLLPCVQSHTFLSAPFQVEYTAHYSAHAAQPNNNTIWSSKPFATPWTTIKRPRAKHYSTNCMADLAHPQQGCLLAGGPSGPVSSSQPHPNPSRHIHARVLATHGRFCSCGLAAVALIRQQMPSSSASTRQQQWHTGDMTETRNSQWQDSARGSTLCRH